MQRVPPGAVPHEDVALVVLAADAQRGRRAFECHHVTQRAIDVSAVPSRSPSRPSRAMASSPSLLRRLSVPLVLSPPIDNDACAARNRNTVMLSAPRSREMTTSTSRVQPDHGVEGCVSGRDVGFGIEKDASRPGRIDIDDDLPEIAIQQERPVAAAVLNLDGAFKDLAHRRLPSVLGRRWARGVVRLHLNARQGRARQPLMNDRVTGDASASSSMPTTRPSR